MKKYLAFFLCVALIALSCQPNSSSKSNEKSFDETKVNAADINLGTDDKLFKVPSLIVGRLDKNTGNIIVDEKDGIIKSDETFILQKRNGLKEVKSFLIYSDKLPYSPVVLSVGREELTGVDSGGPIGQMYYIHEKEGVELSGGIIEDNPQDNVYVYYYAPGDRFTKILMFTYVEITEEHR